MGIAITASNLASRGARSAYTGGNGIRRVGPASNGGGGGLLGTIAGWIQNWTSEGWGTYFNMISSLKLTFTSLWGLITQTVTFIYNFNWQATDQQLDQQFKGAVESLAGQYGGAVGRALGYLVCGVIPAGGIMTVSPLMGAYLLKQVGEEALDDLVGELSNLITASFRVVAQGYIIKAFKNARRVIKKWNDKTPSDSWEKKALKQFFGSNIDNIIDTWGDEGRKPWSFRIWTDKKINSIKNQALQNFVEELYEEFADSCVEAGFILAMGADTWILQQQMNRNNIVGQQRVVELTPDRSAPEERIIIAGGENQIRSQLPMVMSNYNLVENRDVGQWLGNPISETVRQTPNELTLRFQLYSVKEPPVYGAKQRTSISIPDPKKSKLDFNTLKKAIGGNNGYMYGRFLGKGSLDNGKTIHCYCASSQEAEDRIVALAELVDAELVGVTVTEEIKTGARANGKPLQKQNIKVYPYSIYLENKQKVLNQSNNNAAAQTLTGSYSRKRNRIQIWMDEKPDDFDQIINELLQTEGVG